MEHRAQGQVSSDSARHTRGTVICNSLCSASCQRREKGCVCWYRMNFSPYLKRFHMERQQNSLLLHRKHIFQQSSALNLPLGPSPSAGDNPSDPEQTTSSAFPHGVVKPANSPRASGGQRSPTQDHSQEGVWSLHILCWVLGKRRWM